MRTRWLLMVLWIVCAAPMVFFGYGSDPDSWRVAKAAEEIWDQGEYVRSRTTGFPLFEILVSPLSHYGSWYLSNLLAFFSGIALLLALFRLAGTKRLSNPSLVVLCIVFAPITLVNGSSTMDYVPALALLVWSYVMLLSGRHVACGILIGVACGFRPTMGLFVVPCILYAISKRVGWKGLIALASSALVAGIVSYSPALLTYGLPAMQGEDLAPRMLVLIGGYRFLNLLGVVPSLFLGIVLMRGLITRRRGDAESAFHLANVGVWTGLFILMPLESAYLLPALPSLVLLADRYVGRRLFMAFTVILLTHHVVQFDLLGGESGRRHIQPSFQRGVTLLDFRDRQFKLSTREAVTLAAVGSPSILMFGKAWIPTANSRWTFDTRAELYKRSDAPLWIGKAIHDEDVLRELRERGIRLYVWTGDKDEYLLSGSDAWREYVQVVDDLEAFLDRRIKGKSLSERG